MNNDVVAKLAKFSFISGLIGLCTLGICPAFGIMALVVPYVFTIENARLDKAAKDYCKKGKILGIISLCLFVVDLVLAIIFL